MIWNDIKNFYMKYMYSIKIMTNYEKKLRGLIFAHPNAMYKNLRGLIVAHPMLDKILRGLITAHHNFCLFLSTVRINLILEITNSWDIPSE